jgi:hypothetical protein
MQYLGIDWAYRRAASCARSEGGAITGEGTVPADEDGLAKLVLAHGIEVRACVEMMSGAVWERSARGGGLGGAGRARGQVEQNDEWLVGPGYLSAESISICLAAPADHTDNEIKKEVAELQAA